MCRVYEARERRRDFTQLAGVSVDLPAMRSVGFATSVADQLSDHCVPITLDAVEGNRGRGC